MLHTIRGLCICTLLWESVEFQPHYYRVLTVHCNNGRRYQRPELISPGCSFTSLRYREQLACLLVWIWAVAHNFNHFQTSSAIEDELIVSRSTACTVQSLCRNLCGITSRTLSMPWLLMYVTCLVSTVYLHICVSRDLWFLAKACLTSFALGWAPP